MRIVVWNVARGAGKKLNALRALGPDVAIVPECGQTLPLEDGESMAWCGTDRNIGLAVLGFGDTRVTQDRTEPPPHQWVMPVSVDGPTPFQLLAVWANNRREHIKATSPTGPFRDALGSFCDRVREGTWVVAGDFNNNVVWDRPGVELNHASAVADLADVGLSSAYHRAKGCAPGQEPDATFFLGKKEAKPHHIDYCFVPESWKVSAVTVGSYADYCQVGGLSDHAPLIVDVQPAS